MPQIFQVLKCYKCSVFQVHQTKKSNKWECKLCGEKQSIKRHYGLGSGKECRLHVQKLNGIRGEIDELTMSESSEHNNTNDEDVEINPATNTHPINKSKWSNFVAEDDVQEPVNNETMLLGNTEVVLELPKKKRKFNNPKITHNLPVHSRNLIDETELKLKNKDTKGVFKNTTFQNSNSPLLSPISAKNENNQNSQNLEMNRIENQHKSFEKIMKTNEYVPPKVNKNSKWAQFTDDDQNEEATESTNLHDIQENKIRNLFSLCDENELDSVLTF